MAVQYTTNHISRKLKENKKFISKNINEILEYEKKILLICSELPSSVDVICKYATYDVEFTMSFMALYRLIIDNYIVELQLQQPWDTDSKFTITFKGLWYRHLSKITCKN